MCKKTKEPIPMFLKPNQVENKIRISSKKFIELKGVIFIKGFHNFIHSIYAYPLSKRDTFLDSINSIDNKNINELQDK